jgi:hypothetical protein
MSETIERLTPEQELELAACYCLWCGVDEHDRDEWRTEMVTAKRYVRKWMAYWRDREKRKRNETKPQTIVKPCQRCEDVYQNRIRDLLDRSGLDVSPCRLCGKPVICLPDGLACCKPCAEKAGA